MLHALTPARLRISSSPSDPLAWGAQVDVDERTAIFTADSQQPWRVRATIAGDPDPWTLALEGPSSDTLTTGSYPDAEESYGYGWSDGRPRMRLQRGPYSCSFASGRAFDIRRLRFAPDGSVRALWATFTQSCEGAPPLTGELVWNTDTALWVRAPLTMRAETGRAVTVAATATDTRGLAVDYAASLAPAGAAVVDHHDGTASLDWPGGPPAPGTYVVTWVATSADGHADTTHTTITAVRPALFVLDSPAGDPVGMVDTHLRLSGADGVESSSFTTDGWALVNFAGAGPALELRFAGPVCSPLREGVYSGAKLFGLNERHEPGLGVHLEERVSAHSATFHVRHLELGPGGEVRSLWVTFAQRCAGGSTVTTGEVRVAADTSLYVEAPAEIVRFPGDSVGFDVRAVDTRGLPITLTAVQLPAGAAFTPGPLAGGHVTWACADTIGAASPCVFAALSSDGARHGGDVRADVRARTLAHDVPLPPRLHPPRGHPRPAATGRGLPRGGRGQRHGRVGEGTVRAMVGGNVGAVRSRARSRTYAGAVSPWDRIAPTPMINLYDRSRRQCEARRLPDQQTRPRSSGVVRTLWMTFESSLTSGPGIVGEICIGSPDTTRWFEWPADVFCLPEQPDSLTLTARGALAGAPTWSLLAGPPSAAISSCAADRACVTWPAIAQPGDYRVAVLATIGAFADTLVSWVHVAGPAWLRVDADYPWTSASGLHHTFRNIDAVLTCRSAANHAIVVTLNAPGAHGTWTLARSDHSRIVPGSYLVTGSTPANSVGFIWNSMVRCTRTARFDVTEATYAANDSLLSFAATLSDTECNYTNPFQAEFHFPGAGVIADAPPSAVARLELSRIGRNPGGPPLAFALTSPAPGPAEFTLVDVAGRTIASRRWNTLVAGRSTVKLDELRTLSPGCYFARFTTGGASVSRSVVVLR
ncbi:MAG: hypothetical protein IPJ04_17645 [Candidatus Eisenbacteria bacterium]|nr:hypothetical protein [Candidatus Eisenbacteria bacterium]